MKIGHLNIPKHELEKFSFAHDIQIKLYLQYAKLIENEAIGVQLLAALQEDERVKSLEGKMLSTGSRATRFDIKTLAMWFLWAINEYGQAEAEKNLNSFLDAKTIPIINTLWVLGIELNKTIALENGFQIVPIEEMPDSREKEQYLKHDFHNTFPHSVPKPKAAIIYVCDVAKTLDGNDLSDEMNRNKDFWNSSQYLHEISLALNALDDISCIPYFSTSYSLPNMPIGLFAGSGGGSPIHDVFGYKTSNLAENIVKDINALMIAFNKLSPNNKSRLGRILSRLSQAKRREQIEDKILDLGIALEMSLLEDNKSNDQLSLSFRLRGSWLLGKNKEERRRIFRQLKDLYVYRSQVAHSGILCGNDQEEINSIRGRFKEYSLLAEKTIRHLMLHGSPDWTALILDIGQE